LKDKALAAHRVGIRRVIAPLDNQREVSRIPESIREQMEFHFVDNMDDVIALTLLQEPKDAVISAVDPSLTQPLPLLPLEEPAASPPAG